jgi:hypothetical protein
MISLLYGSPWGKEAATTLHGETKSPKSVVILVEKTSFALGWIVI